MSLYHGYGTVKKEYKLKPKKAQCSGCRDDFYNDHNPYGVKECWCFKTAKVVDKIAYPNIHCTSAQMKEYKRTLSCYHGVNK